MLVGHSKTIKIVFTYWRESISTSYLPNFLLKELHMHLSVCEDLPILYIMCSVNQGEHIQPDGCYHSKRATAAALLTNASSAGKMRVKDHLYLMLHRSSGAFSAPTWPPQLTHTCSSPSDKHTNAFWRLHTLLRGRWQQHYKKLVWGRMQGLQFAPVWMVDAQASSSPAL